MLKYLLNIFKTIKTRNNTTIYIYTQKNELCITKFQKILIDYGYKVFITSHKKNINYTDILIIWMFDCLININDIKSLQKNTGCKKLFILTDSHIYDSVHDNDETINIVNDVCDLITKINTIVNFNLI